MKSRKIVWFVILKSKLVNRNTKRGKILNCSSGLIIFKVVRVIKITKFALVEVR